MGVWEEMERDAIAEGITQASERIAHSLIKAGKETLEEIANICGLPLQRVKELANIN